MPQFTTQACSHRLLPRVHSPVQPGAQGPQEWPQAEPPHCSPHHGAHTRARGSSPQSLELGGSLLPAGHKPPPDLASHHSPPPPAVNKLMITGWLCLDAARIRRRCWLLKGGCSPDPTAPVGAGVLTHPTIPSLSSHPTAVTGDPHSAPPPSAVAPPSKPFIMLNI